MSYFTALGLWIFILGILGRSIRRQSLAGTLLAITGLVVIVAPPIV